MGVGGGVWGGGMGGGGGHWCIRRKTRRASGNATYERPEIQAPTETQTHTLALEAGACSGSNRANHYTTRVCLVFLCHRSFVSV